MIIMLMQLEIHTHSIIIIIVHQIIRSRVRGMRGNKQTKGLDLAFLPGVMQEAGSQDRSGESVRDRILRMDCRPGAAVLRYAT